MLVKIDNTAAKAKLRRLILKKYRLVIMQARLEAEMKGQTAFAMPEALAARPSAISRSLRCCSGRQPA